MGRALERDHDFARVRRDRRCGVVGVVAEEDAPAAVGDALLERTCADGRHEDDDDPHVVVDREGAAEHEEHRREDVGAGHRSGRLVVARRGCGRHAALEAQAEGEGRRQQEVRIPERVLEHAVHGDEKDDDEGGPLDRRPRAVFAPVDDRVLQRAPERIGHQGDDDRGQREPHLGGEVQDQVVAVVEELGRAARERRQGPGEVEVVEANAEPGMRGDERDRVRPDAEPVRRDVAAAVEPRLAGEDLVAVRRPQGRRPPRGGVEHRRQHEHGSSAPRQPAVEQAPAREREHAERTGARRAQDDHVHERQREARGDAAVQHLRLAEPDRRHDRPQEQAAEVIRLAQIARRPADVGGERDPVSVGEPWCEHLHRADQRTRDAGNDETDAEGPKGLLRAAGALRRRGDRNHQDRGEDRPCRRERERPRYRDDRRGERADRREEERREQGERAARARPAPSRQRGGEDEEERAPADERRRLIEEGRRGRHVGGDERRYGDRCHGRADRERARGAVCRRARRSLIPCRHQQGVTVTSDAVGRDSIGSIPVTKPKRGMIRAPDCRR